MAKCPRKAGHLPEPFLGCIYVSTGFLGLQRDADAELREYVVAIMYLVCTCIYIVCTRIFHVCTCLNQLSQLPFFVGDISLYVHNGRFLYDRIVHTYVKGGTGE
jgi:hypothetical protein